MMGRFKTPVLIMLGLVCSIVAAVLVPSDIERGIVNLEKVFEERNQGFKLDPEPMIGDFPHLYDNIG